MSLSTQQLQTIKADVQSNPATYEGQTLAQWWAASNPGKIAAYYRETEPTFYVWRTRLSADELRTAALNGAAEMDNLEAGKRDALFWMLDGSVDPSLVQTRQSFLDLTANRTGGFVATALRTALSAAGKRTCNRIEKLLSTGTGTEGSPATMGYEFSNFDWPQVIEAMES